MKKFVNRYAEIETLEQEYNKNDSSFVVIYGRRRIGKTSLLSKFAENKKHILFLATEEAENENKNEFAKLVADFIDNPLLEKATLDWSEIFDYLIGYKPEERKLIIIDEFQYIGKSNPAFISKMQKIWDTKLKNSNVMLVLCGSLVNMMYGQTLAYNSPLYGRRTKQIKLKQIAFKYYNEFFEKLDTKQLIESYAVTGGVPKYIESFNAFENIYTAIEKCILSKESYLYEEPEFLLKNEVQEVGSYFSIIKTIAAGNEKLSDISSVLEIKATNLPKYLKTLIDLDIIEREVPVTEDKPEKSKMGLYKIKDNYIRFWFKFIYPNKSYLESNYVDFVMKKIKESFISNHVAYVYEDICRNEYMQELVVNGNWNFTPVKIGRWWNRKDQEIDIVAFDDDKNIIFGECKYTASPMDVDVYYNLLKKKEFVNWKNEDRNEYFVLFSVNGYSDKLKQLAKEKENILLY